MSASAPLHLAAANATAAPRVALASRGDALTPYLAAALERRYPSLDRIDPGLTPVQRYGVAALTVRPTRSLWAERFYKSGFARRLRSANAARQLRALPTAPDAVVQVHLLFDLPDVPTTLYVDCTHRQSAEQWAPWNPLRGRALEDWYRHEATAYRRAAHVFAFSEDTRASLLDDYGLPAEDVTVVGAGVNADPLPALPAPHRRQDTNAPTVLFIGNDFVRKGGMELLAAFRQVRRVLPEARLQLVGTRPPVAPEPGVEILGRVTDRARIEALYQGADVFAVPSFFDPFPLVALEAMAFGVPVIAGRQTGTPEMIEDGTSGRLVTPGSVDELAAALLEVLLDDAVGLRWRAAARRTVETRFTWDAVVDRMAPALDALPRARP